MATEITITNEFMAARGDANCIIPRNGDMSIVMSDGTYVDITLVNDTTVINLKRIGPLLSWDKSKISAGFPTQVLVFNAGLQWIAQVCKPRPSRKVRVLLNLEDVLREGGLSPSYHAGGATWVAPDMVQDMLDGIETSAAKSLLALIRTIDSWRSVDV